MAKFVIAGRSDCPYYARCELLGDELSLNVPDFQLHKIVIQPGEWEKWLKQTCNERNWNHKKSPLIWRELIDRGGKGVLVGGANEFQEYAECYYGIESKLISSDMQKMSKENEKYKEEVEKEEKEFKSQSNPLQVCITFASSPVCYSMINEIAKGEVFGQNMEIALRLYDSNDQTEFLEGLKMEAFDLANGLLRDVTVTTDLKKAFKNCSAIILMDEIEQTDGQDHSVWVKKNAELFTNYAKIINDVAKKNVKILLTGEGPMNLNAFMMINNAPNIPRQNIAGLSRLVENQAKSVIASKLNVNSSGVVDLVIWGNVNGKYYIDLEKCRVHGYEGAIWGPPSFSLPVNEMIWDKQWIAEEFPELVKSRTKLVEDAMKHKGSMSKAASISTMVAHWWRGSPNGQIFSLAVCSEGWYDVPKGLVCSFPVTMHPKGYWCVVQDIDLNVETKDKIKATIQDIIKDKEVIFPPPTPPPSEVKVTIVDPKDTSDKESQEKVESDQSEKKDLEGSSSELSTESGQEGDSSSEPKLETIVEEKAAA